MRLVTKYEDVKTAEQLEFLKSLVDDLRVELAQCRAQIDEAREIPPYPFDPKQGKLAKVHVMNDAAMAKLQRGETLDER